MSPKVLIENIPVIKMDSLQSMNSNIECCPKLIRGFYKSLSVMPQNPCKICDDGSQYDSDNGRYLYCPKLKLRLDLKWRWRSFLDGFLFGLILDLVFHFLFCYNARLSGSSQFGRSAAVDGYISFSLLNALPGVTQISLALAWTAELSVNNPSARLRLVNKRLICGYEQVGVSFQGRLQVLHIKFLFSWFGVCGVFELTVRNSSLQRPFMIMPIHA